MNTYSVPFEGLDTSSTLGSLVYLSSSRRAEFPHFDCPIQTAADEVLATGRERNAINAVLVTVGALKALDKMASSDIPNTNTLIQGPSSDKAAVGRDGNSGNSILNSQRQHAVVIVDVPKSDGAVTTAGGNGPAISREVQAVDVLFVAGKRVSNGAGLNVPDSDQLVLCARSKVLAVGAEADASDVQVTTCVGAVVLQDTDLLSGDNIVDLSGLIAARCDIFAIHAEPNTAHDALMCQSMDEIHVEHARYRRVEDKEPVVSSLLVLGWQTLNIEITKSIVGRMERLAHPSVIRSWVCADLWGLAWTSGARKRDRSVDLRSGRTTSGWSSDSTTLAGSWTGIARRRLRGKARSWSLRVLLVRRRLGWRRRRRRRTLESRGRLRHLVRWWLLLLRRRGRGWDRTTLSTLARHDGAESIGPHADGWWRGDLWRAGMRRGADHGALRSATSGLFELATQMSDLFFKPAKSNELANVCERDWGFKG